MKHFTIDEFDSPDAPGSGMKMHQDFLMKLDVLRELCGFPFQINSGYRTPEHNRKVSGATGSEHTRGRGADIHAPTSQMRFTIVTQARSLGFTRIGVGKTFVHVGDDPEMPQDVMWLYE